MKKYKNKKNAQLLPLLLAALCSWCGDPSHPSGLGSIPAFAGKEDRHLARIDGSSFLFRGIFPLLRALKSFALTLGRPPPAGRRTPADAQGALGAPAFVVPLPCLAPAVPIDPSTPSPAASLRSPAAREAAAAARSLFPILHVCRVSSRLVVKTPGQKWQ